MLKLKIIREVIFFVHTPGNSSVNRRNSDQDISIGKFNSSEKLRVEYACNEIPWKKFLSLCSIRCRYASLLIYKHPKSGYGAGMVFFWVAQATLELLPIGSKERRSFDGCLRVRE